MRKHTAHLPTTLAGIASAVAVMVGIGWWVQQSAPATSVSDPVANRDIIEYFISDQGTTTDALVTYAYKGNALPKKMTENEVVEKRTASSYTKKLAVEEDVQYYETVIYAGEPFVQDNEGWYEREVATTTKSAFDAARRQNPLAALFIPRVEAASDIAYGGVGDGYVQSRVMNGDWNSAVITTVGYFAGTGSLYIGGTHCPDDDGVNYCMDDYNQVYRSFIPFDTSALPAEARITSATLNMYVTYIENGDNDGLDYITVVQTNQPSATSLTTSDFDNAGAVNATEGVDVGQRKDMSSITTNAYMSFTLNSTGIGWIKTNGQTSTCGSTAGYSCFGLREGHDITNTTIAYAQQNYISGSTSETSGTSQDPYLSVVYAEPNTILKGGRYQGVRIF